MLIFYRRIEAGAFKKILTSVVVLMGDEQPGPTPEFDGARFYMEKLCNLSCLHESLGAQSCIAALQSIVDAHSSDDETSKRFAAAGMDPLTVECIGNCQRRLDLRLIPAV